MIKKASLIVCSLMLTFSLTIAQPQRTYKKEKQKPDKEQIINKKCKEIIKALSLDNSQAELLTKTYTSFYNESFEIKKNYKKIRPQKGENGEMKPLTDEEVEQNILNSFKEDKELLALKEKYYIKYRKFLSPQEIQKLYMVEKRGNNRGTQQGTAGGQRPGSRGGFNNSSRGFGGGFGGGFEQGF